VSQDVQDDNGSQTLDESLRILIQHDPGEPSTGPVTRQIHDTNVHIEMERGTECGYSQRDGCFESGISLQDVDNGNTVLSCVTNIDKDQSIEAATADSLK
jgi:hypothetical protein